MKDYRYLVEQTLENLDLPLSDFWLYEGVTEFAKQFPKMSEEKLRKLLALDPTYKGGEQVGKYGNWIIRLFYNNIKNRENNIEYRTFLSQNPSGINPKTGKPIQAPVDLPATPWEDAEKIPNLLKQYELLKNKIKKPITEFKDLPSLYNEIQKYVKQDVPMDKKALERYYVFKDCMTKGLKKIYEDSNWMIGIPETLESSIPFGQFTNWCTTSSHGRYYNAYLNQYGGEYYILLDKRTGELFQFHFESKQFMNEADRQIDMYNFTKEEPKICKFLFDYKNSKIESVADENIKLENKFKEIITNPEKIRREILAFNDTKDVKIEGDKITGVFNLDDLSQYVYSRKSNFSLETVCGLLTDFYSFYSFGDYSLSDYSYQSKDWDEFAKKYGIEKYNWNEITQIYEGFYGETPQEIIDIIEEDFYDGVGLLSFLNQCSECGTENECHKDIIDELKDNLPIAGNYQWEAKNYTGVDFELSINDLWKIYYVMTKKKDDIPEFGKEYQRELSLDTSGRKMNADWFEDWQQSSEDDWGYDAEAFEDWLYCWRVANNKCELEEFEYGAFEVREPYYGWNDFDDKYFEEGCESAAERIAEILNKELSQDEVE